MLSVMLIFSIYGETSYGAASESQATKAGAPPEDVLEIIGDQATRGARFFTNRKELSVTVIGDSVTLGAQRFANIENRIAGISGVSRCMVDARGSRQFADGVSYAKRLKSQGKLGRIVVFALATNSSYSYEQAKAAFKAMGENRYVIFVTGYVVGYTYFNRSNEAVRKLAGEEPRVFVADWNSFIKSKSSKHFSDNYCHVNHTSGRWYTDQIIGAVKAALRLNRDNYSEDFQKKDSDAGLISEKGKTICKKVR